MKQGFQAAGVGLFFLLGITLIYMVFTVIGDGKLQKEEGYAISATFNDLKTLTPGADVRLAGVRVGTVRATGLVEGRARADLLILPEVRIPEDSIAAIAMSSLLGQNYIALEYGSSDAFLTAGASIETAPSADFNEVIRQVSDLGRKLNAIADSFSGLGGEDMNSLFANLNQLVIENRHQVDNMVDNLEILTERMISTEGTLGKFINDPEAYNEIVLAVREIRQAATDAQTTLAEARQAMAGFDNPDGSLGRLLNDDTLVRELEASVANLRQFSDKLNSGDGTLGKLVTDDELYRELRSMLQKADQALDSVGDSGPITAVSAAASALF
jgi:phospholipid/cholesterol/gamma-HCH transport system substrate-binding protein